MVIELDEASVVGFGIGGAFPRYNTAIDYYSSDHTIRSLTYPPGTHNLIYSTAPLKPGDGKIKLQLLIDRTSVEIFGNEGEVSITNHYLRTGNPSNVGLHLYSREGNTKIHSLEVYKLNSAWRYQR